MGWGWEEDGDSGKGRLRGEVGRGTRRLGRRAVVIWLGGRWLLGDAAGRGGSPPVTGPARWLNNWEKWRGGFILGVLSGWNTFSKAKCMPFFFSCSNRIASFSHCFPQQRSSCTE